MEKRFRVTHQFNWYSSQSDMQSKQTRCALIAARLHGGAHAAVGYTTVLLVLEVSLLKEILFQKFCKRL